MSKVVMWRLIAVFGGLMTLLVGYLFVVGPARSNAEDLHAQADQQVATNERNRQKIAQYEAQAAEVPAKQAEIAEVEAAMPATLDQSGLVRSIESEATTAGVTVQSLTPGTPAPSEDSGGAPYLEMPLAITATGSYSQIKTFVNGLENMDRAYLIEGMKVSDTEDESGALTLDTQGKVFTIPAADLDTGSGSSSSTGTQQGSAAGKLPKNSRDPMSPRARQQSTAKKQAALKAAKQAQAAKKAAKSAGSSSDGAK